MWTVNNTQKTATFSTWNIGRKSIVMEKKRFYNSLLSSDFSIPLIEFFVLSSSGWIKVQMEEVTKCNWKWSRYENVIFIRTFFSVRYITMNDIQIKHCFSRAVDISLEKFNKRKYIHFYELFVYTLLIYCINRI